MGGIPSTCVVRRRKTVQNGSSDLAVEKRIKAVDRAIGALLEQSAISPQRERDAVVPSPLGDLAYVTARCHHDRDKAVPKRMEGYVVQPDTQHRRPQDSASPRAKERAARRSVNTRTSALSGQQTPRGAAQAAASRSGRPGRNALSASSWARCPRSLVLATGQPWTSRGCASVAGRCRACEALQLLPSEVRRTRRPGRGRGTDGASGRLDAQPRLR
jgi:hypothetical protein